MPEKIIVTILNINIAYIKILVNYFIKFVSSNELIFSEEWITLNMFIKFFT